MNRGILLQDLEFLQMLGNIDYIIWLASNGYFNDTSFTNYLEYLLYINRPEYAHLLLFPQSISILNLITSPRIRDVLLEDTAKARHILTEQSFCAWASFPEIS